MKETRRRLAHPDRARVVILSLIPRSQHTVGWYENETIRKRVLFTAIPFLWQNNNKRSE